jgi:hypothetical protein
MNVHDLYDIHKNMQRRLQLKQVQAARYGINAPAETVMECEDLQKAVTAVGGLLNQASLDGAIDVDIDSETAKHLKEVNIII